MSILFIYLENIYTEKNNSNVVLKKEYVKSSLSSSINFGEIFFPRKFLPFR